MDVSGGETAPEPDTVMDSDKDFEPVESEDEVVPRNIEIARNLQKTQKSTSLAQWFNKYHAGLEVMGSIPMGDFHI